MIEAINTPHYIRWLQNQPTNNAILRSFNWKEGSLETVGWKPIAYEYNKANRNPVICVDYLIFNFHRSTIFSFTVN